MDTNFPALPITPVQRVPNLLRMAYNTAVGEFTSKHNRTVRERGAAETDMLAIDKAAKLFVEGVKALSEAVNGCHMTHGEVEASDVFERCLEAFVEGLPRQAETSEYVDAVARVIYAEVSQ